MKIACNEKRVNTFDMVLIANSTTLFASILAVLIFGSKMSIDKRYRMALLTRCVIGGALGIACFSLGAVLIPMTLQLTVGNLAPFFAGIMGYMLIGEEMNIFEIAAMFVSFGAIVLIALAQNSKAEAADEEMEPLFFAENPKLAGIIGCSLMVILSITNGFMSVLTRIMQGIPVSSMMVYISVVTFLIFVTGLLIENAVKGGPMRILNYSGEQYGWGFAVGAANVMALYFKIMAY